MSFLNQVFSKLFYYIHTDRHTDIQPLKLLPHHFMGGNKSI